jgi:hypothetical protein
MLRFARAFIAPAAILFYVTSASADNPVADQLYAEGKTLLEAGKVPEACEKFKNSQQLEANTGTLLALATCHEQDKKFASAWYEYETTRKEYARANRKPEAQEFCASKVAELGPKLQRIPMSMADKPVGVSIEIDGQALGEGPLLGAAPIDRGEHTIVVKAPGKKRWEKKVTVVIGTAPTPLVIPALEPAQPGDPEYQAPGATGTGGTGGTGAGGGTGPGGGRRIVETEPDYTKRTIGIVVGGVGVAAGIGALIAQFGFAVPNDNHAKRILPFANGGTDATGRTLFSGGPDSLEKFDECPDAKGCTQQAYKDSYDSYKRNAKNSQITAIGLAIGGGVALGIGIFLIATSGGSKQVEQSGKVELKPTVRPYFTGNSAGLVGSF